MNFCKICVTPDTRPLTTFVDGVCGACRLHDELKLKDWSKDQEWFAKLCDKYRGKGSFDCIVPVSGGKDGSYVAWIVNTRYNMKPLCVTFAAPMWTELGLKNLDRFRNRTGFPHVLITPPIETYRAFNKLGFIRDGYPKRGFVAGLAPSVTRLAIGLGVKLIVWGEHEEVYEGRTDYHKDTYQADYDFFVSGDDFCGHDPSEYLDQFNKQDFVWWLMPSQKEMDKAGIYHTHWSKYELWNDEAHRAVAVQHCGLGGVPDQSHGTWTSYSQVDDNMQPLFMYLAFVKYGLTRAGADCNLAIRHGRMTRKEAVDLVNMYGDAFPYHLLQEYQGYFNMTADEIMQVIRQHANKDIVVERTGAVNYWQRPWEMKEPVL